MPAPLLSEVQHEAEQLVDSLVESTPNRRALWQIEGPPTAGKSACLARVAEQLAAHTEFTPVLIAPPPYHLDAGAVALTDTAVGLGEQGIINGQLKGWSDGVGKWVDRIEAVGEWVTENREQVILLCDAPSTWGANRDEDDFFRRRGFQAAVGLASLECRRVIAGAMPVPVEPERRAVLSRPRPEVEWLTDPGWGTLTDAAAAVADSELLERPFTPLGIRLLVASVALSSPDQVRSWFTVDGDSETRVLIEKVAELIRRHRHRLWDTWLRFSLTRRPFDDEVFDSLLRADVPAFERDIARHCLLFGERTLRMHDALKLHATHWRRRHLHEARVQKLVRRTNKTLFEIHRKRFDRFTEKGSPRALSESMEAFHFASVLGNTSLREEVSPLFVDQLDALGWSLSYERHRYQAAADVFEEALRWDPKDAYAHHYLAFNLDRLGKRLGDVETHFRNAVELELRHPWWHSRLIIFLIDRGRLGEAREAWEDAMLELGLGESESSTGTYEHLHCWVAGALLRSGEPVFAREVLDAVPEWAHAQLDAYEGLSQRADALLQLGEGDPVVPGWRLRPGWWQDGPELLQHRVGTDKQLVKWMAGRVEAKDEQGVHIRAAVIEDAEADEPAIAWSVISETKFNELCRDEIRAAELPIGTFLETGLYVDPKAERSKPQAIIRVLPVRNWANTPELRSKPDRHLGNLVSSK